MRVHVIHPSELGPGEIAVWRAMQRATQSLSNPFLSPSYAIAVGTVRPQSRVAVLMDGASIIGFFPFEKRRLGIGVPISGWVSSCQGVVHAAGAEWNAMELLRGCGLAAWKFDNLIPEQEPFQQYHLSTRPAPVIDLSCGFGAYYAAIRARKTRFCRELERKARKIEREIGDLHVECGSRDLGALRTLMAWKSEQYQRTAHVDRFEQPWLAGLLERLLACQTADLTGLLSVMSADGQVIAVQLGLRSGGLLVGWFTGYDTRHARYSPGLINLLRMAETVAAAGVNTIHMGKGALKYSCPLQNDDLMVSDGVVTSTSVVGMAQRAYSVTTKQALTLVRQAPILHRTLDRAFRRVGISSRTYGRL
jgi:CelD/BcsL family acetyltransferase involved in cellulose biosynthesis